MEISGEDYKLPSRVGLNRSQAFPGESQERKRQARRQRSDATKGPSAKDGSMPSLTPRPLRWLRWANVHGAVVISMEADTFRAFGIPHSYNFRCQPLLDTPGNFARVGAALDCILDPCEYNLRVDVIDFNAVSVDFGLDLPAHNPRHIHALKWKKGKEAVDAR